MTIGASVSTGSTSGRRQPVVALGQIADLPRLVTPPCPAGRDQKGPETSGNSADSEMVSHWPSDSSIEVGWFAKLSPWK